MHNLKWQMWIFLKIKHLVIFINRRGSILAMAILMYVAGGPVGGFCGGNHYSRLGGRIQKTVILNLEANYG